jgi:hypothetical protein
MKKKFVNESHLEGYLYEHDLTVKESGKNSKVPGTVFISGTISIATDNAITNIVPIHFTYVTATTSKGGNNATFKVLKDIIDGTLKTYMEDKDKAVKLRVDSALNLNEFYTTKDGKEELVSARRNEGGFVHIADSLDEDENKRNTFKCDFLIHNARRVEADEEKNTPEKMIIKGHAFDFRNSILPMEFTVLNPAAMDYFESLEASPSNPILTNFWGQQISETVVKRIVEESAFGSDYVREVKNNRKDFVITGALKVPYEFGDESVMTADELKELLAAREVYVADIKKRQEEYEASKKTQTPAAVAAATASTGETFNF